MKNYININDTGVRVRVFFIVFNATLNKFQLYRGGFIGEESGVPR